MILLSLLLPIFYSHFAERPPFLLVELIEHHAKRLFESLADFLRRSSLQVIRQRGGQREQQSHQKAGEVSKVRDRRIQFLGRN